MLKAPSQLDELRPLMFPSLQRAPDHPTPLQPFATSPVPVMFGRPNITGEVSADNLTNRTNGPKTEAGALSLFVSEYTTNATGSFDGTFGIRLDASDSNGVYGASSSVQPPSIIFLPCIKI